MALDTTSIPALEVRGVTKSYQGQQLLSPISFTVGQGEIAGLLGPSGTGKTTLLRIIAGLEDYESGQVLFAGRDLKGVPVHKRDFGLMFQDLALFPHQNVFNNVAFGLRMHRLDAGEIRRRVVESLELVGLDPARFAPRDVNRLSGGEQQRVALARSLAPRPRFLMFDEPLGALDRILREQLVQDVRALLKHIGMTALYVTHDQEEAFAIADKLIILNAGRVEQSGAPVEVYQHPTNSFVARFMGLNNLVPAQVVERHGPEAQVKTDIGMFCVHAPEFETGREGILLLRPQAIRCAGLGMQRGDNVLFGRVTERQLRGGHARLLIESEGQELTFEWDAPLPPEPSLGFELDPAGLTLFGE